MSFEASRRKQVLVLQPKGKALYDDESSFGSKMLAKMGWNKGSGLGKEQHGSVDFIQIRYKNNANGLGFNGLKDDQWTENESNFDDLLKSLNNANSAPGSKSGSGDEQQLTTETKSLEEKSKLSRARVHYKKFTRGKDVHKYSEKDLANILGKKTLKEVVERPKPEEPEEEEVDVKPDMSDSNLIISKGVSVADYFKQKMAAKLNPSAGTTVENVEGEKQKKKKKRKLSDEDNVAVEDVPLQEEASEVNDSKPLKKSKRKKNASSEEEQQVVEEVIEEPPKKKKKSKKNRELEEPETVTEVETPVDIKEPSLKVKKKKKSKIEDEISAELTVEEPTKASKKDKKNQDALSLPQSSNPAGEPQRGANSVYSTNIIQIPSYIAQKLSSMSIHNFNNANLANVVGYGLSEDIEIKTVQTKIGQNADSTDKYALYNMDRMTGQKVNPRKIISKLKRTKKSIQVI